MKRTHNEKDEVLRQAFVALVSFSRHSLSPTQSTWARERAGNCLWALGIDEYEDFRAIEPTPVGETLDLHPTVMLQNSN